MTGTRIEGPAIEVRGHRLDGQQYEAVMDDSDTELVIAAAGTGKTTTLIGKVRHLVDSGADPSKILLISLTNNTVDDLRRAVRDELGDRAAVDVMTIHALGNRILRKRPCVGHDRSTLLGSIAYDICESDRRSASAMISYVEGLRTSGMGDVCFNGQTVRPRGMRILADEMCRCGIGFEYTPQSYSEKGAVPAVLKADDGNGHRIEIDSESPLIAEFSKTPEKAKDHLASRGFDVTWININDFAADIVRSWGPRLSDAVGAFISRCKCTRTTIRDLLRANGRNPTSVRPVVESELKLLDRIWDHYTMTCVDGDMVDYDDMVILAADQVRSGGSFGKRYTHVLVDEYQDVSRILVDLLAALRDRMRFKLFCVGDDWQSIYLFSGGDIGLFYNFEGMWKGYGSVSVKRIETTYRCPQTIVDLSSRFVSKNRMQQRKNIRGLPDPGPRPAQLLPVNRDRDISKAISNRLDAIPQDESVFIIGRTRADLYALGNGNGIFGFDGGGGTSGSVEVRQRTWDQDRGEWRNVRAVRFLTAHSSKGLEADNVFILADRDRGGFPNTTSDAISDLFGSLDEDIELPEERRVFYVAMTRARRRMFIVCITDEENYAQSAQSPFVRELLGQSPVLSRSTPFCPECFGPLRISKGPQGLFYGCVDYPGCKGTRPFNGI